MLFKKMKSSHERWLVISLLLVLALIGAVFTTNWPYFEVNPKLSANAYDILLKYIFIIIVCERGIEVYNAVRFQSRKIKIQGWIKTYQEKKASFKKLSSKEKKKYSDNDKFFKEICLKRPDDTADIQYHNLIERQEEKLDEIVVSTRKFTMRVLMFFGLVLAIAGLSILSDLIEYSDQWYCDASMFQKIIIRFLDIVLTGALIGGGSKSFHALLSTIHSVLDNIKQGQTNK